MIKKGDPLFTIYAEKEYKLDKAVEVENEFNPIKYEKMVRERYSGYEMLNE